MESAISSNNLVTKSVTLIRNSHCIICGKPFPVARMGKLYCSAICKQFGFNYKEQISRMVNNAGSGINSEPSTFYLDDYLYYDNKQRMLKKYRQLKEKSEKWKNTDNEISAKQSSEVPITNFTWNLYTTGKLTEDEEFELYDLENEIEPELMELKLKELSIEQWSFIKSLNPSFDEIALCQLIASLSINFFSQLNIETKNAEKNELLIIKNKFINHCNLIANGQIQFIKKKENK